MSDLLCLENLPILDLWKSFRMSLGYESVGEKARQSRDSVLEFWSSEASFSERDCILLHSPFKKVVLTIYWKHINPILSVLLLPGELPQSKF